MKRIQTILAATALMLFISTASFAGTITGSRTNKVGTITGSKAGTITGSKVGTITGSAAGTITGSRTSSGTLETTELLIAKVMMLALNLAW